MNNILPNYNNCLGGRGGYVHFNLFIIPTKFYILMNYVYELSWSNFKSSKPLPLFCNMFLCALLSSPTGHDVSCVYSILFLPQSHSEHSSNCLSNCFMCLYRLFLKYGAKLHVCIPLIKIKKFL